MLCKSNDSPICLCGESKHDLAVLRSSLSAEGFCVFLKVGYDYIPELENHPLTLLNCKSQNKFESWIEYVNNGGVLILCNPSLNIASQLGFKDFKGIGKKGILSFPMRGFEKQIQILL